MTIFLHIAIFFYMEKPIIFPGFYNRKLVSLIFIWNNRGEEKYRTNQESERSPLGQYRLYKEKRHYL